MRESTHLAGSDGNNTADKHGADITLKTSSHLAVTLLDRRLIANNSSWIVCYSALKLLTFRARAWCLSFRRVHEGVDETACFAVQGARLGQRFGM